MGGRPKGIVRPSWKQASASRDNCCSRGILPPATQRCLGRSVARAAYRPSNRIDRHDLRSMKQPKIIICAAGIRAAATMNKERGRPLICLTRRATLEPGERTRLGGTRSRLRRDVLLLPFTTMRTFQCGKNGNSRGAASHGHRFQLGHPDPPQPRRCLASARTCPLMRLETIQRIAHIYPSDRVGSLPEIRQAFAFSSLASTDFPVPPLARLAVHLP